jgi:hypothetical protein
VKRTSTINVEFVPVHVFSKAKIDKPRSVCHRRLVKTGPSTDIIDEMQVERLGRTRQYKVSEVRRSIDDCPPQNPVHIRAAPL